MIVIPDWLECPESIKPDDYNFWIRSTIVYHGEVITATGTRPGTPDFSARRWSVIRRATNGDTSIEIGAVAYTTGFDTDDTYAVHKKYIAGEWDTLMHLELDAISQEAILHWTGEQWTQGLNINED